jgi:hypothetical protein
VGFNAAVPYRRGLSIPVPGYEALFRTFSIALPGMALSGDPVSDAATIVNEVRRGRLYSSVDAIGARPVFGFTGISGPRRVSGGDVLPIEGAVKLRVDVQAPLGVRVRLLKDGASVREVSGTRLEHDAGQNAGAYRVEVIVPDGPGQPPVPWIVSNPIYVGYPETAPAAPGRGPAKESVSIYSDGPAAGWEVERGPNTQAALDVVDTVGGTQVQLRYALSGPASASPFAAVAVPAPGPALAQHSRLIFRAQADRPMRLSVQLRTDAPGQRWQRSVYVDETSREIAVFFDEFTAASPDLTPRVPLEQIKSILFVVDTVNTRTGTAGRVFLDDLRYAR